MQRAHKIGGKREALLIAGPTASGKSGLALRLAEQLLEQGQNPVIINADSMQVYRDLDIVTARPTAQDLSRIPHFLYGTEDGSLGFSTEQWRELVSHVLDKRPNIYPIFVGGTGLYFRALTQGLSPMPAIPQEIRRAVRDEMIAVGPAPLHEQLDKPMQDQLSPSDSQRVARALEVLRATGKSLAHWQQLEPTGALVDAGKSRCIVLDPPRPWLETRIRERARAMLGKQAQAEVAALLARDLSRELPVMRAIGVSVVAAYVQGEMSEEDAVETLTIQTRRYAKRQGTWFRGQMPDWQRFDPSHYDVDMLAAVVLKDDV